MILINIFKNEKNYIYTLLKSVHPLNKDSPLQIAYKNPETFQFLLSFIKENDKKQLEKIIIHQNKDGNNILNTLCKENRKENFKLVISKFKSNKLALNHGMLAKNRFNQSCVETELFKTDSIDCTELIIKNKPNTEILEHILLASIEHQKPQLIEQIISKVTVQKLYCISYPSAFISESDYELCFF